MATAVFTAQTKYHTIKQNVSYIKNYSFSFGPTKATVSPCPTNDPSFKKH